MSVERPEDRSLQRVTLELAALSISGATPLQASQFREALMLHLQGALSAAQASGQFSGLAESERRSLDGGSSAPAGSLDALATAVATRIVATVAPGRRRQ